jgi:hypothetical protein
MPGRHIGQCVRVADACDRYHGTRGSVCGLVPAFGTVLYRITSNRFMEYGEQRKASGWACLFFPRQLRKAP